MVNVAIPNAANTDKIDDLATDLAAALVANTLTATVSHEDTKPTVTPSVGGTITGIATTTKPSGTDGTDYYTIDPGGSVTTNGSCKITPKASITAGYSNGKNATGTAIEASISATVAAGTNYYLVVNRYHTGSTAPASTLGIDGDIYLVV